MVRALFRVLVGCAVAIAMASCGGGGGGGSGRAEKGVFTGVLASFNFDYDLNNAGGAGGDGGAGGADGDGGVGAGGALGQFLGARVFAFYLDGTPVGNGNALTDPVNGMVTIKAGRGYTGGLLIEIRGEEGAQYFEEGKNTYVPFPPGEVIRAVIPKIDKNIGITPFTDSAYTLAVGCVVKAIEGVCDTPVPATATPGAAQALGLPPIDVLQRANERVTAVLNQQFPTALQVDDIGRLPYIVGAGTGAGAVPASSQRGRYGLVNVAFSKQAAMYNTSNPAPTLLAIRQLASDLSDGTLDGLNSGEPAAPAAQRTYDPATFTTELSSALAQQTTRYGATDAIGVLPRLVGFGSARYDSYFFEARVVPNGTTSTVAVATQAATPTRTPGQATNYVNGSGDQRGFVVFGNNASGSLFIKTDSVDSTSRILAIGDNTNGELGNGDRVGTSRTNPAYTITLPGVVTHITGGFGHTVARLADGSVYAWGDNAYGQIGQGNTGGRALTPTRVQLPAAALSVAAGNTSSFALLADGRVFAWGSNWGFGTLGNGSKDGTQTTPGPVKTGSGDLTNVVQLSVRDNDGIALRGDGTVWTWGSFPGTTDATDFVPVSNAGGRQVATQVTGLPATAKVRKIITDQGLFAALLSGGPEDGAVYTWGVYFDITAGRVLADLVPQRVLNLPPLRDLMPGAFQAYGQRPTDRDTALGVDYEGSGNFFRIRGRVAERYDPADPLAQRRPKGQAPRPDCGTCHTVRGKTLPVMPTSGAACSNIPAEILSLLTSQSSCESCHNGAPLSNRPALPILECVKPALPAPPTRTEAAPLTTACSLPAAGHVGFNAGTSCSTCHNSVIAPTLRCEASAATFAAPLAVTTDLTQVGGIAPGGATNNTAPVVSGTISTTLAAGQVVQVLRDSAVIGNATVAGTSWTFADSGLGTGRYSYTARVAAAANAGFGVLSNAYPINVDLVSPDQSLAIESVSDNVPSNVGTSGFTGAFTTSPLTTDDTTPTLSGTLSTALRSGETLRVLRNGVEVGTSIVNGLAWTFTDNLTSGNATYAYQVRMRDAAGNTGLPSNTFSVNLLSGPTAIANIVSVLAPGSIPTGGGLSSASPQIQMSFSRGLLSGESLSLTRQLGNATPVVLPITGLSAGAQSFNYTDAVPGQGTYLYRAKIVNAAGNEQTTASQFTVVCGTSCITLANTIAGFAVNGSTATTQVIGDTTPTLSGTASGTWPTTGLSVAVLRDGVVRQLVQPNGSGGFTYTEPALTNGTYAYTARVQDTGGNRGSTAGPISVSVSVLPTITSTGFVDNAMPAGSSASSVTLGSTSETDDTVPVLTGTLGAALFSPTQSIVVRRIVSGVETSFAGTVSVNGQNFTFTPASALVNNQTFTAGESNPTRVSRLVDYTLRAIVTDGSGARQQAGDIQILLQPICLYAQTTTHTSFGATAGSTCSTCHRVGGSASTRGPGFTCRG